MRHIITTLTALTLLSAASTAQTAIPGAPGSGRATFQRNFQEMIDASTTRYEVPAGGLALSPTRELEIHTIILSNTDTNLQPDSTAPNGQRFYYDSTDVSAMLHFDTNNSTVVFDSGMSRLAVPGDTPNLPSESAAPALAMGMIQLLTFDPVNAAEMTVEHVGGMGLGMTNADGSTSNYDKLRTVRFGRRLGGMRVEGPGSRMIVHLGEDGELQGASRRWHEFDALPIAAAEKNTPEDLARLLNRRMRQSGSAQMASEIEPQSATLVLYDDGEGYAEPVIRFEFELTIETNYRDATGALIPKTIKNPLDFYIPILRQPNASMPFVKDMIASTQGSPSDPSDPPAADGGDDE